jgi:hypothetical protein
MDAVTSEFFRQTNNVAQKWRDKQDHTVDSLVVGRLSKELAHIPAKHVSRCRGCPIRAAFEYVTSQRSAAAKILERGKRSTDYIAVGIDSCERKLKLRDIGIKVTDNCTQSAWLKFVVGVKEQNERGFGALEPEQARRALAAIVGFKSRRAGVGNYVPRAVCRPIVDYDELIVAAGLIEHAPNSAANECLVIVTRDNYGELRTEEHQVRPPISPLKRVVCSITR